MINGFMPITATVGGVLVLLAIILLLAKGAADTVQIMPGDDAAGYAVMIGQAGL
jgi:hypothetical protein